jgi:hypothetical protein
MRLLLAFGALLFVTAMDMRAASAQPWCAHYDPYTYNCGFYTFEQCLATVSGVGGVCRRNPRDDSGYDRRPDTPRRGQPDGRRRSPSQGGGLY